MAADPAGARRRESAPLTVVVDDGADGLAALVAKAVRRRRRRVIHVEAPRLGLLDVHLESGRAEVEGQPLAAVLFRATPWNRHDAGYAEPDGPFASAEVTATWLAITRLPTVTAINRLHPEASVTFSEWPVWRRSLADAGIPQPAIVVGDVELRAATWLPWGGGIASQPRTAVRRCFAPAMVQDDLDASGVWLDGALIDGSGSGAAAAAAAWLATDGLRLAGITVDRRGRVVQVAALPILRDAAASAVADRVAEALAA